MLPAGEEGCEICGPDHEAGRTSLRRSRRRNLTILLALLCAAAVISAAWLAWPALTASPAQKLLVTSDDLGDGWQTTAPEKGSSRSAEVVDTASVRVGRADDPYYFDGRISLTLFSTEEGANASFQDGLDSYGGTSFELADGTRAMSVQHDQDGIVWHQLLMMQKGGAIVWISLGELQHSTAVETAWMLQLAEAQAAKLA